MLKEMPKVGDKVRYIGEEYSFMTVNKEYEVTGVKSDGFFYLDDEGNNGFDRVEEFHEWAPVNETTQPDAVNSPSHYTQGAVEVIDIIRQATDGADGFEGLALGNVIKYVMRYRHKNGVEDLRKAAQYLTWLIEDVDAKGAKE